MLLCCRDLAEQTHKCFQAYGKYLTAPALSSVLLVGGLDAGAQLKALKQGEDGVATPLMLLYRRYAAGVFGGGGAGRRGVAQGTETR
jgi:superfamily II DNA/RNA helicase